MSNHKQFLTACSSCGATTTCSAYPVNACIFAEAYAQYVTCSLILCPECRKLRNDSEEVIVECRPSYQGIPQYGITGHTEITPSRKTAEKWAALENARLRSEANG
jgi:hypothetical protein